MISQAALLHIMVRSSLKLPQQLQPQHLVLKQQLQQQVYLLSEDNKKMSELENTNKTLLATNETYIQENHNLQGEKYKLEQELEKLKNRGFFARLFNKN